MGNLETKINNLSEISLNNNDPKENTSFKFYTSPDDLIHYRAAYPYNNYTFTPQNIVSLHENFYPMVGGYPIFPTIPAHYKGIEVGENYNTTNNNLNSFNNLNTLNNLNNTATLNAKEENTFSIKSGSTESIEKDEKEG